MAERNPPVNPPTRLHLVPLVASAVLPGLGQAVRRRWGEALLLAFAALWLHGFLAAHAEPGGRLLAFAFGAPAIPRGFATPVVVVFTVIALGVHGLAAWGAGRAAQEKVGEV